MNINRLLTLSITIFCFVITLCSSSQSMDNPAVIEEKTPHKYSMNMEISLQSEINALDSLSGASRPIILEDTTTSWKSYLISPVKVALQRTYEAMDFARKNPNKAAIIGFIIAYQATVVAANCSCYCNICVPSHGTYCDWKVQNVGTAPNLGDCANICLAAKGSLYACK